MRWWFYVIAGCLAYLFTLIAYLPIQHFAHQLSSSGLPLVIGHLSGTIWHGEAGQVNFRKVPLGPAKWRFVPLGLLYGQIQYSIEISHPDLDLNGYIAKSLLSKGFTLLEINGRLPVDSALKLTDQGDLKASGQLELDLAKLQVSNRRIVLAEGEIRWLDAGIERPFRVDLGNLQFNLSGDEQTFFTAIRELDGPLQVNGDFNLLPDGSYRLQGTVKASNGANAELTSLLQSIGRPAADGSIQVDYAGQM
jgi:general secretion pathway protein N